MVKVAVRVLTIAALATLAPPLFGEEDFPLVGTALHRWAISGGHSPKSRASRPICDVAFLHKACANIACRALTRTPSGTGCKLQRNRIALEESDGLRRHVAGN